MTNQAVNSDQESELSASLEQVDSLFPQIGDHIYCKRRGYSHHGVYIGDDQVVHYSGLHEGLQTGPVVTTSLDDFLGGADLQIKQHRSAKLSPEEIKQRALSRLGENLYHPLFNNCEHFAEWCVMAKHRSKQIDIYASLMAGGAGYMASKLGSKFASLVTYLNHKYNK